MIPSSTKFSGSSIVPVIKLPLWVILLLCKQQEFMHQCQNNIYVLLYANFKKKTFLLKIPASRELPFIEITVKCPQPHGKT